ncbi:MAG: hypothetical protein SPI91_05115 [Bacilli bacterium]|uniref:hypothetical protein n=2 Tax=Bacteria TaxID=2 RepID=UPI00241FB0C1|nr:hypothetical protein [Paraclostridium bifermentans]MDY6015812.1 hypothetical protein [Bacilli bacterium]
MEILEREDYNKLNFEDRCRYINQAILTYGTRASAYKNINIAKSTVQSMMKSHKYIFDNNIKQFVPVNTQEDSMELESHRNTQEDSMELGSHRNTKEGAMVIENVFEVEEYKIFKAMCEKWDVLQELIRQHEYKQDVLDVDTTVTLKDIPDGISKRVNWDINETVLNQFKEYIKINHKNCTIKNMVEIALLQYIRDKR